MNVPDDWGCHWTTCVDCGNRYHASEGGCDCGEVRQSLLENAIAMEAEVFKDHISVLAGGYVCIDQSLAEQCGVFRDRDRATVDHVELFAQVMTCIRNAAARCKIPCDVLAQHETDGDETIDTYDGEQWLIGPRLERANHGACA